MEAIKEHAVETEPEAVYALERPVKCPSCRDTVESFHVVRLLRTKVNVVSSLPRMGYAITCPSCSTVVSAGVVSRMGF